MRLHQPKAQPIEACPKAAVACSNPKELIEETWHVALKQPWISEIAQAVTMSLSMAHAPIMMVPVLPARSSW